MSHPSSLQFVNRVGARMTGSLHQNPHRKGAQMSTDDDDSYTLTDIAETLHGIRSSLNAIALALQAPEPWNVRITP